MLICLQTLRRGALQVVPLLVVLILMTSSWAEEPPGLKALTPADIQVKLREPQCEADVILNETEQSLFLRIIDGNAAFAHFAKVPSIDAYPAIPESSIWLFRSDRRKLGGGQYRVEYGGALPPELDAMQYETFRIALELTPLSGCTAQGERLDCESYTGNLSATYVVHAPDRPVRVISTPSRPVILHEWCSKDVYRYSGMFVFPGFLDIIGGWLLQSR